MLKSKPQELVGKPGYTGTELEITDFLQTGKCLIDEAEQNQNSGLYVLPLSLKKGFCMQ